MVWSLSGIESMVFLFQIQRGEVRVFPVFARIAANASHEFLVGEEEDLAGHAHAHTGGDHQQGPFLQFEPPGCVSRELQLPKESPRIELIAILNHYSFLLYALSFALNVSFIIH